MTEEEGGVTPTTSEWTPERHKALAEAYVQRQLAAAEGEEDPDQRRAMLDRAACVASEHGIKIE